MKPSYFQTPRSLEDATFHSWGQAIESIPSGIRINAADVILACVIGICGAMAIAHWMAS